MNNKIFIISAKSKNTHQKLTANIWLKKYLMIHKMLVVRMPQMNYRCLETKSQPSQQNVTESNFVKMYLCVLLYQAEQGLLCSRAHLRQDRARERTDIQYIYLDSKLFAPVACTDILEDSY